MYDQFSNEYDRFVDWKSRLDYELPFITAEIQKAIPRPPSDIRIIDMATGTGMHAIALAQKGYHVLGMDISAGMIDKACLNASHLNADVQFEIAGFGSAYDTLFGENRTTPPSVAEKFDVALCLGNSLPHVEGAVELDQALKDFAKCLKPGGILLLQSRNFDSVMPAKERWMEPQYFINNDGEWLYVRMYDFLPDGHVQFNILTLIRTHRTDTWKQSVLETRLYPIMKNDLANALEAADFTNITVYGSLANIPFDATTSGNLVITALKK